MPTYEYQCPDCQHRTEVFIAKVDSDAPACPDCGSPMQRVMGCAGVIYKGTGFYCTDHPRDM
jgi:putative FmdB family regulatory protein